MNDSVESLESALQRGRNSDGGWGYYPGKRSRLEPTCWALLALNASTAVLQTWPAANGMLLERSEGSANYGFQGLALLTLLGTRTEHGSGNGSLVSALQGVKGVALPTNQFTTQNNALQAWSWIPDTFSWVEPTAWCLLAVKKWVLMTGATGFGSRIGEAEALLLDRSCAEGGWNYGTANVLGKQHTAYVPTTAVALLALQDRRAEAQVKRSLDYLARKAASEQSGMALSLALLALKIIGLPTGTVEAALLKQLPTSLDLGNQLAVALALFSLRTTQSNASPFTL